MRAIFLLILLLPATLGLICPYEYFLVNEQKCLKMYFTKLSHPDAETTCKSDGGTLVTIKNAIDNRAVYNFVKDSGVDSIWIGLSCFGNSTSGCFWDDASGSAASYSNSKSNFISF